MRTTLVTAKVVAKACGVSREGTVLGWAKKGIVPFVPHGKQKRFDLTAAVAAYRAYLNAPQPTTRTCFRCNTELPLSAFRHSRSYDCTPCHKAYNRTLRERDAKAKGKKHVTREDLRQQREARKASEVAARELARSERVALRATPAERYRDRYCNDPSFREREKARRSEKHRKRREGKGRAKRAASGSQQAIDNRKAHDRANRRAQRMKRDLAKRGVCGGENVKHELVAVRDGWRCAICGGKVTKATWSLDHVVPISCGGMHTYGNCVLAHRLCNSHRGAGRLPSQFPMFARPVPAPTPAGVGSSPPPPGYGSRRPQDRPTPGITGV